MNVVELVLVCLVLAFVISIGIFIIIMKLRQSASKPTEKPKNHEKNKNS